MLHTVFYSSSSWLFSVSNQKDGVLFQASLSFLIAILLVISFVWHTRKSRKATAPPLPPGPRGLPIVGYLPFLGTDNLHLVFTDLARVYGPIYKLWLGNKLCVVIGSPELAKQVVRDHDITFGERDSSVAAKILTYGGNDIVFDSYSNPEWKIKRKVLVREMLSNTNIKACHGLRREQLLKTLTNVYKNAGKPIDFGELAFLTSISSVMGMLLGGKQGEDEKKTGDNNILSAFRDLMTEINVILGKPNISDVFPVLAWFDIQGLERDMKKICHSFDQLYDSLIEARRNVLATTEMDKGDEMTEQKDFLQILLELMEKDDSELSITMNQLKALLMDVVVGGTDTTATMIVWTMAELMQHPKEMEKVKKEIDDAVGPNSAVEEVHLPNLLYLNAVIKETFRLHPPIPLLVPRCSGKTCTVGGYTVPKGTRVFLNVWSIQRDPHHWESPSEFRPERFLNTDPGKFDYIGNDFQYMPFGSGRRRCAGVNLGERMLYSTMAALLHSYDWKLPLGADQDLSSRFGIVMKKMKPLLVIPTPTSSNILDLYMKK